MLSRLLCVGNSSNILLNASQLRTLTWSAVRGARPGVGFNSQRVSKAFGISAQKTGTTLRERLLGPTTGKPFLIGTYALAGASVFGVGALCFYGLIADQSSSILQNSVAWPQYVHDRIKATYGYLGASLAITAGAGIGVARTPALLRLMSGGTIFVLLGSLAAVIGTGAICRSISYESTGLKQLAWMTHCATLGAVLAPLCFLGGAVLIRAAWYTAGIVAGLSATAACAPNEKFLMMSGPLAMGLGIVFVSSIGTWFLPPTSALGAGIWSIAMYGGLILFAAFLLYDTQRVVKLAENYPPPSERRDLYQSRANYGQFEMYQPTPSFDPINAQMSIYLDVLNIFMRLAMILGMGGNRRK